jgi:dolichol-phosphate mannosyltransferase
LPTNVRKNFTPKKLKKMISVIIPCYNEEKNIALLHQRTSNVMRGMSVNYELIFVNDGSADTTAQLLRALALEDENVVFIDLSRNFGHQIAVSAGIEHAKGDAVVIIDADLQDPPELIAEMYQKLLSGFQVVYAKRIKRKGETFLKKLTAKVFYRLMKSITNFPIPVDTGDFRIMDRKVVDALKSMPESSKYLRGQIAWIGFEQTFVEYEREERHAGKTGYSYKKMIKFALDGITGFSNLPIKLASFLGFMVSGIAFLLILYALYSKYFIHAGYMPGWASLMIVTLFIGGIQLICVGILGEYISRINTDVKRRPLYFVKEIVEKK